MGYAWFCINPSSLGNAWVTAHAHAWDMPGFVPTPAAWAMHGRHHPSIAHAYAWDMPGFVPTLAAWAMDGQHPCIIHAYAWDMPGHHHTTQAPTMHFGVPRHSPCMAQAPTMHFGVPSIAQTQPMHYPGTNHALLLCLGIAQAQPMHGRGA